MIRPSRTLPALAALLLAGTAAAVPAPPPRATIAPPTSAEFRATASQAIERGRAGDCRGALALLDPLVPRLPAGDDRAALQLLRMPCLASVGRGDEASAVQRELAQAMPKNGLVQSYGVIVAAAAGHAVEAAEKLEAIAVDAPDTLALVPGASWRGIAQKLTEDRQADLRGRVTVALARADWQPPDEPDMRDMLATDAIEALLRGRETSEAGLMLGRVDVPELLFGMATERVYQPLWPAIEARMGPAQARVIDRFAAQRLDALARADGDPHARRDGIRAFILLGRYADADALAQPVAVVEGMDRDAVASVRYHAQALAAQGKRGDAIARLQPFATLDLAKTPDAASGVVSLAEMLDEAGRANDALAVARGALAHGDGALSPWGVAWLRRTEVCALSSLGRTAEATAKGDALRAAAADNEAATIEGLLCAGRSGDAAQIAIRTLGTTDGADRIADQFQPDGALWGASASRLRALWAPLLARPDVKAAFGKVARILPRPLWPARTPRPIPRAPDDDGAPTT